MRVWYAPVGDLGGTVYPVNGFIYADGAPQGDFEAPEMAKKADKTLVASLDLDLSDLTPEAGIN